MITKEIQKSFDTMPSELSLEQAIEHIVFIDKVNKGLEDSDKNRVYSQEESKKRLKQWLL